MYLDFYFYPYLFKRCLYINKHLLKSTIEREHRIMRSNIITEQTETSRMYPKSPPNAGHIANADWSLGLFSAMSLGNHMNGMLLGQRNGSELSW